MQRFSRSGSATGSSLGRCLVLAVYLAFVMGPVLVLAVLTIQALLDGHLDWLQLAVPSGRRLSLLLGSVALALRVSVLSTALGWLVAVLLWSRREGPAGGAVWLVLPLIALPPYVHALAWYALEDALGVFLAPWGLSMGLLEGQRAALWVETAAFAPLALGCAWLGLWGIDGDLVDAGRAARPDIQTLLRIVLPLSAPAILTGAGIIFLLSLLDYSVPSLFHTPVYAMEIFAEFSASHRPERAFLISIPLLILAVAVIAALLEPVRTVVTRVRIKGAAWTSPPHWPRWMATVLAVAAFLFVAQALSPLLVMIYRSGHPAQFFATLADAAGEVRFSLWTAALTALLTLPFAVTAARLLLRLGRSSRAVWLLILVPFAIPGSLVGIGLVHLTNRPWLQTEVVAGLTPALAGVARFAPLAALLVHAQFRRPDPLLHEAAQVFQPACWRRQVQISLPLVIPGLLAGAGLAFALSMGELAATLMVVPPGRATLTMRIYNYLHYGATDTVAGLCLALVVAALAAGMTAAGALALWSRIAAGGGVSR